MYTWETPLDYLSIQRGLEDRMLGAGSERFRKRLEAAVAKGKASEEGAGIKLLQRAIVPTEQAIVAWLAEQKGKNGRPNAATKWIELVRPDVAAFMIAKTVIDNLHARAWVRAIATEVSGLVIDELRWRKLEEERPGLFKYRLAKLTPGGHYGFNKASLDQTVRYAIENTREEEEPLDLSEYTLSGEQRIYLGTKLLDLFIAATGLVEAKSYTTTKRGVFKGELLVQPTPATMEWVKNRNAFLEFLTPVQLPMVLPPKPWTATERGGYFFALRDKHPFVRSRVAPKAPISETVLNAVNAIQDTPWTINQTVLDLADMIKERGVGMAGMPAYESLPLPPKPADIAENEVARREWRKKAHLVYKANRLRAEKVIEADKILQVAHLMRDHEAIYFPHNCDFRGRVYPIPVYLHPQGNDLAKALLLFADAKPLGEMGAFYLAVHGANMLDVLPDGTKVKTMTLAERSSWIQQNTLKLVAVAQDPMADLWWTEADKPLQFYAFCVEWARFWKYYQEGRPFECPCALPVAQDGSCNGLQHFAALLRDEIGGAATNVTANERPEDVYTVVAEEVDQRIAAILADPDSHTIPEGKNASEYELAKMWVTSEKLGRKLAKRPTMTFGYGSKRFGFADQILEYLKEDSLEWLRLRKVFTTERGVEVAADACRLVAGLIWDALQGTVVAAAQGMEWMQECAGLIAKSGHTVEWKVPATEFPVSQPYFAFEKKQVKTILAGQVVAPSVWIDTTKPRVPKQRNAIAPNMIHSLDAAVLMLTVLACQQEGIQHFGMVHDSYATVPADCETMARLTRETFVRYYEENNVVQELQQQFVAQHADCPEPPPPGTLDIREVLRSDYFFS